MWSSTIVIVLLSFVLGVLTAVFAVARVLSIGFTEAVAVVRTTFDRVVTWLLPGNGKHRKVPPVVQPASIVKRPLSAYPNLTAQVFFVARPAFTRFPQNIKSDAIADIIRDAFVALSANHIALLFRLVSDDQAVLVLEVSSGARMLSSVLPILEVKNGHQRLVSTSVSLDTQVQHILTDGTSLKLPAGTEVITDTDPALKDYSVAEYLGDVSVAKMQETITYSEQFLQQHTVYNMFELLDEKKNIALYPLTCQNFALHLFDFLQFDLPETFKKYELTFRVPNSFRVTPVADDDVGAVAYASKVLGLKTADLKDGIYNANVSAVWRFFASLPSIYLWGYLNKELTKQSLVRCEMLFANKILKLPRNVPPSTT